MCKKHYRKSQDNLYSLTGIQFSQSWSVVVVKGKWLIVYSMIQKDKVMSVQYVLLVTDICMKINELVNTKEVFITI